MDGAGRLGLGMLCFGVALFNASCGAGSDGVTRSSHAGLALVPLDSVLLAEADTLYVGRPTRLIVDPLDGSFYVTDPFSRRVYRFARDGSPVRTYGRPGRGPGEFNSIFGVVVADDSTLAAPSVDPSAMHLFDRQTGELRSSFPLPPILLGTGQAAVAGDAVWLPARSFEQNSSFLVWLRARDSTRIMGSIPAEYERSREARGVFHIVQGSSTLAHAGHSVLVGWAGSDAVERFDLSGRRIERIEIPRVRRRGVPPYAQEWIDQGRRGPLRSFAETVELHSQMRQFALLSNGLFGFTHHDLRIIEDHGPSRATIFGADLYVGVLSADLDSACVDTLVPAGADLDPRSAFLGDTLFVLDRRIVDDERVETRVLIYGLDTSTCDWLPTSRTKQAASSG